MMRHGHPDDSSSPSDEILDEIGAIAMHRHAIAAEAGHATASRQALEKLQQLLTAEREALQAHGPGGHHAANIAALTLEIEKLKAPPPSGGAGGRGGGGGGGGGGGRHARRPQRPGPPQGGQRNFPQNKRRGRRGRG